MKVLLLGNGESIHTARWANGLVEVGLEVVLATQHKLLASIDGRVRVRRLPLSGLFGYFVNAQILKRILKEERPDVLHAHYASGYGTTARLARFHPYVLSVWGSDVFLVPNRSRMHRSLLRKNLMSADQVTSTGRLMARQTKKIAPALSGIEVVAIGVDVDVFRPSTDTETREDSPIVVGTVKALSHVYGIDILLESFSLLVRRLHKSHPEIAPWLRLRIVGGGPDMEALRQTADRLGIGGITEFVGRVSHENVPDELRKLDFYVALSRSESFGVAILEASATGLPVVVSDVGGLPEVVVEGVTGYIVQRESPSAAADALEMLVLDPSVRRAMGERGRSHVLGNYQWKANVQEMIAVYEQTVGSVR